MNAARIVPHIVAQHCEETAHLLIQRWHLLEAAGVSVTALRRIDARLAAHMDGLRVAGNFGRQLANDAAAAQRPPGADAFAAAVLALEAGDLAAFLAPGAAAPLATTQRTMLAALDWVSAHSLRGTVRALLDDPASWRRLMGIAACIQHRVDPGQALDQAMLDADPALRAVALRYAGESGRMDLRYACGAALADTDPACRYRAARSAALLGDRTTSTGVLEELALQAGPARRHALCMVLTLVAAGPANSLLKAVAQDLANIRLVVRGAGAAGDPYYVQWLIGQMDDPKLARLAGEAFSFITGVDLGHTYLRFDRAAPADFQSGPTDNPDDNDVAMDDDDGLPWPDPVKLQAWWDVNHMRFEPGVRYFMGERVTVAHCKQVLRDGLQRQRVAAADYLCLLAPGTPLFPTSAPSWRQQRWLRQMR